MSVSEGALSSGHASLIPASAGQLLQVLLLHQEVIRALDRFWSPNGATLHIYNCQVEVFVAGATYITHGNFKY